MSQRNSIKNSYTFKYILVGDSAVGKTKIAYRFQNDEFSNKYTVTLNLSFTNKVIEVDGESIKINLCDTAGDEKFRGIMATNYKNSICILFVYDITKLDTFQNIKNWKDEVSRYANENKIFVLVGNKSDLEENREIKTEEGQEFAEKNNMLFFETSALNGNNIQELFNQTAKIILDNIHKSKYFLDDDTCGIIAEKINTSKDIKDPDPCSSCNIF